jgi:hypothetical protein
VNRDGLLHLTVLFFQNHFAFLGFYVVWACAFC